jgi:prepilin-type N-terminal cleavage/methylation domain-containing protein
MPTLSKKGFTLIEVVVSMGILALVFSGTVALIVQLVGLTLSSRMQTQAVAYAQDNLNKCMSDYINGIRNVSDVTCLTTAPPAGTNFNLETRLEDSYAEIKDASDTNAKIDKGDFAQITIIAKWKEYGRDNEYTLKQFATRKN